MITPAYAPTATERVLPRLALDFTTASLDPRVTVTRALNTATVTNANGSITIVNANLPRFDYANGVCKGLLIEETRSNLLTNSIWAGAVAGTPGTPPTGWLDVVTTGSISAINSASYAAGNALTFTCAAQRRFIYQQPSVAANTSYTASFNITATTSDVEVYSVVDFRSMPAGAAITGYTLDGVAVAGSTPIPAGPHKVTITAAIAGTAGTIDVFIGLGVQANITSSVAISNIQLEAGAFATSYIPTTTTSLTRNADDVSMTGTNFSDWYSQAEGTFAVEYSRFQNVDFGMLIEAKGSSTNTAERVAVAVTSSTDPRVQIYIGGANILDTGGAFGVLPTQSVVRFAMAYKTGSNGAARLGGAVSSSTTAFATPAYTEFNIGGTNNQLYGPTATSYMNGHMRGIRFWPQRLTNSELQAFSKL